MTGGSDVRVFFYGSFMNTKVLRKRGVEPRDATPALLPGWALVFQPMANVVPAPRDEVRGVVTTVDRDALTRAYRGDALQTYSSVVVDVELSDRTLESVECYVAPPSEPAPPSTEYLKLLTDAAIEHGLPTAWTKRLERAGSGRRRGDDFVDGDHD